MAANGSPRFLLIRIGSLGDVIHTIPAAAALRARFSASRIDWVVDPKYVEVLKLVTSLDHIIPLDLRASLRDTWRTVRGLRTSQYDAAIDLQGLIKSAVIARAAGALRTIGFSKKRLREPLAATFYTDYAPRGLGLHVIDKNLSALNAVGVQNPRTEFPLQIPATAAGDAVSAAFPQPFAILNPSAGWPNKRWPPDRFGELAAAIHARFGMRSLVLWGPGEEEMAAAVSAASSGAAQAAPATTLTELFDIIRRARILVSGDTGPMHIGTAVGTPLVGLFGPTRPERNGPFGKVDVSVSQYTECECQYDRQCHKDVPCIENIQVADVVKAVERRLLRP